MSTVTLENKRVCQVFCVSFEKIFLGRESSPVLFSPLFNELIQ